VTCVNDGLIWQHRRSSRLGRGQVTLVGLAVRLARQPRRCRPSTSPAIFAGRAPCIARQAPWPPDQLDPSAWLEMSIYLWGGTLTRQHDWSSTCAWRPEPTRQPPGPGRSDSQYASARVAQVRATSWVQAWPKWRHHLRPAIRRHASRAARRPAAAYRRL